jgi:hypothetical protein
VARTEASTFPWNPSGKLCRNYFIPCLNQPNPTIEAMLYTISRVPVMDMTAPPPSG